VRRRPQTFTRERAGACQDALSIPTDTHAKNMQDCIYLVGMDTVLPWLSKIASLALSDDHRRLRGDSRKASFGRADAGPRGQIFAAVIVPPGAVSTCPFVAGTGACCTSLSPSLPSPSACRPCPTRASSPLTGDRVTPRIKLSARSHTTGRDMWSCRLCQQAGWSYAAVRVEEVHLCAVPRLQEP
jgi:hypothetical protein